MNKTELIAAVASKTELTKKDTEKVLKAFTDVVAEELKKGEKVIIDPGSHEEGDPVTITDGQKKE